MAKNEQAEESASQTSALQLVPCERNHVLFPLLLHIVNLAEN
jgi:hypothetical protein